MDKNMKIEDMPILLRREVEALILKPFLEAFEKEVGKERTLEIVCQIMREKAGEQGRALAARHGVDSLEDVETCLGNFMAGGALDLEFSKPQDDQLMIKTTRCEYVAMYERLGMKDWGCILSCLRDEALYCGMNPNFKFERTQTLMTGGCCCDSLLIDTKSK